LRAWRGQLRGSPRGIRSDQAGQRTTVVTRRFRGGPVPEGALSRRREIARLLVERRELPLPRRSLVCCVLIVLGYRASSHASWRFCEWPLSARSDLPCELPPGSAE